MTSARVFAEVNWTADVFFVTVVVLIPIRRNSNHHMRNRVTIRLLMDLILDIKTSISTTDTVHEPLTFVICGLRSTNDPFANLPASV